MYEECLLKLGFSKNEASVYLALFELGWACAGTVAKKLCLNRSTVYSILNLLREKGFIGVCEKNGVLNYAAVDPEVILEIYQQKNLHDKYRIEHVSRMLTGLNLTLNKNKNDNPKVCFFNGLEGIKTILTNTLLAEKIVLRYSSFHKLSNREDMLNYFSKFDEVRFLEKKISIRLLTFDCETNRSYWQRFPSEFLEICWIKKKNFLFDNEIFIYGNKIAIISIDEMFGILIESETMVEMLKKIFELTWIGAKAIE